MTIEVKLFASLKDKAGQRKIKVALDSPATVRALQDAIVQQYPAIALGLPSALVAVNQAFASAETLIQPNDEVALFPPVSGG